MAGLGVYKGWHLPLLVISYHHIMQNFVCNKILFDVDHSPAELLRFFLTHLPRKPVNHHNYNTLKHLLSHLPTSAERDLIEYILFDSPQLCRTLNRYYKIKASTDGIHSHWIETDVEQAACYFFGVNLYCANKSPLRQFFGGNAKNRYKIYCSDCFENLVTQIERRQISDGEFTDSDQYVRIPYLATDRSICCNCSIAAHTNQKVVSTEIANIFVYTGPPNRHTASVHALCDDCFAQLNSLNFRGKCLSCGCSELKI